MDGLSGSGLFKFAGRESRKSFWRWYLRFIVALSLVWVTGIFAVISLGPFGAPVFLLGLPLLVAYFALWVRRAHDRNHGMIWFILVTIGPYFCLALSESLSVTEFIPPIASIFVVALVVLATFVLNIWFVVELMFRRGSRGPNRFGALV